MTNKTEDKQIEQVENYIKSQNDESNKHGKIISFKLLILIAITFITPLILTYTIGDYPSIKDYLGGLGIIVYFESFFIYFIKKLAPRINLAYIWAFLLLVILFFYQSVDGRGQLVIIFLLIFIPLLGAISYFGGNLITAIILAIQRAIKKEKVYDEEMKKICEGLGIGLLIIIWLLIHFYN